MRCAHPSRVLLAAAAACALLAASSSAFAAKAEYKVGFITSMTGPVSSLGIPFATGMKVAHLYKDELDGRPIKIITMDSGSNPTQAGTDARKLTEVDHVDVLIGAADTPDALAISAISSSHRTPFITAAHVLPYNESHAWTINAPQPISIVMQKIAARMKHNGVKTVGYIGFADAWGDEVYDALRKFEKPDGYKVITDERYARSDSSVTGQVLRIIAAHPDAVINGGAGTPGALPYVELKRLGYKGQIYGTHAYMDVHFTDACGSACNGMIAAAGPLEISPDLPDSNPTKPISTEYRALYKKVTGKPIPGAFSSYTFDAYLIFLNAASRLPKDVQPGTQAFRTALKDAIQTTKNLAGTQAVYNFTPGHMYGVTPSSIFVVKLENGAWHWDPLKQ
ncbi:MAG TPA: ABC transporter substrate-binding protein [Nevskiaceae bacterium]